MTYVLAPAIPEVQRLTAAALAASRSVTPSLTIRCKACGTKLAQAGYTARGPLFTSSWIEPPELGIEVFIGQGRLEPFPAHRWILDHCDNDVADDLGYDRNGTIALLTLPPGMDDDYPDLVVRCNAHGTAVLDRHLVIRLLPTRIPTHKVAVSTTIHETPGASC